ncbi:hypothetical protein CO709_18965 [Burkholderia thailandensis]|uniref:hypothetical protein n=1 Tax=Burkholderia TaxID=32008 RepID=UPI00039D8400|nr:MULTISPECIES: hypothetical protein [Burkholderia]ATF35278.1 hypothetical protein CO709_18965 [Burkholderia thailandensis]
MHAGAPRQPGAARIATGRMPGANAPGIFFVFCRTKDFDAAARDFSMTLCAAHHIDNRLLLDYPSRSS